MTRRNFLGLSLAGAAGGCVTWGGAAAVTPNYWCTWGLQNHLKPEERKLRGTFFEGDQPGADAARNNLNEQYIFEKGGWVEKFPNTRNRLFMMLDDGWDVPYGCSPRQSMAPFGAVDPHPSRFPSLGSTQVERLTNLNRRLIDGGWQGAGLWVACQQLGDERKLLKNGAREALERNAAACAAAGIRYWKVDWGVRGGRADYRELVTEVCHRVAPGLIVEHAPRRCSPFNQLKITPKGVTGSGRYFGMVDDAYDLALFAHSDVMRIYDLSRCMRTATALERIAYYAELVDRLGGGTILNVESCPVMGAVLGHAFGLMVDEGSGTDFRAIRWQEIAPVFGGTPTCRTVHSAESLTDEWDFQKGDDWMSYADGHTLHQTAPAVIARGLALPVVTAHEVEKPFVACARHPNGAVAVGAFARTRGRRVWTPWADVALEAELRSGVPCAVFGRFASVSFRDATQGARLFARDLADGPRREITAVATRANGRITLPGRVLEEIGLSGNPPRNAGSTPAVCIEVG